jgi:hypothetical protein
MRVTYLGEETQCRLQLPPWLAPARKASAT